MRGIYLAYKNSFSQLDKNIWILSAAQLINRSGSMVLLFSSLFFIQTLGFNKSEAGFIMSFYGFGSILGSYTGGWLTDRFHYKSIMIFSLVSSGLSLPFVLLIQHKSSLCLIMFGYAFLSDIFRPAASKAISVFSSESNRTRSISLLRLAINLGFSIGPVLGGIIAFKIGYSWLYWLDAITSVGAAILLYSLLPRTKAKRKLLSAFEKKKFTTPSAYRNSQFLFFTLLVTFYGALFFQLFTSVPVYFKENVMLNEKTIGLLLGLNGLLVFLLEMPIVAKLESSKNNLRMILIGVSCLPLCFGLLALGNGNMAFIIAYTFVITLSEIFAMPFMMNYLYQIAPAERQGQYSALYSIAYGISNILAPLFGLWLAHYFGFERFFAVLVVCGIVLIFGVLALKFWNKKKGTQF